MDLVNSAIGVNTTMKMGLQSPEILSWLSQYNVNQLKSVLEIPSLRLETNERQSLEGEHLIINGDLDLESNAQLTLNVDKSILIKGDLILKSGAKILGGFTDVDIVIEGNVSSDGFYGFETKPKSVTVNGNYNVNSSEQILNIGKLIISNDFIVNSGANIKWSLDSFEVKGSVRVSTGNDQSWLKIANDWYIDKDFELSQSGTVLSLMVAGTTKVSGHMLISEQTKLTSNRNQSKGINLNVATLFVMQNAEINVSGVSRSGTSDTGCYAGNANSNSDCHYGYFKLANLAGTDGGASQESGGFVQITALEMTLNGAIKANGINNYGNYIGGSGGSIHLNTAKLLGHGSLEAFSDHTYRSYIAGSGGRISIYSSDTSSFEGVLRTVDSDVTQKLAPAGTQFIANDIGENGVLVIDNIHSNSSIFNGKSTPIRGAGTHQIDCVTNLGQNLWRIDTDCSSNDTIHWVDSSEDEKRSLIGREVDLDINNDADEIVKIISNDKNSLVVETNQDLSSYTGATLQGIHRLKGLKILNSAHVDFGNNRVEVSDINDTEITRDVIIKLGAANSKLIEKLNNSGANIIWH
ncbi:hypothetical protein ORJ66_06125 [Pseudoalteromonas tunicata]|uniref:hypothetical protein n=1 Tax=Pseudoalteromonas tunicata TaxID=314281 RepID=UPI00273D9721|nr:hypothetical protein [Pseudoalteromonas tunicata]MDP5212616.1 hypothetical protein [Pseudoalteromonas tunicata]